MSVQALVHTVAKVFRMSATDADPYILPPIREDSNLGRIARGFDVGDPAFDALPMASLQALVRGLSPDVCGAHDPFPDMPGAAESGTEGHSVHMQLPHWADADQLLSQIA